MIKQKDMIYPETYYCAKCDNCGADWSDDYNGFTAFGDKGQMEDHLNESEWHSEGEFGTTYNRIDGQIIFEWFAKYLDKKAEEREKIIAKEKADHNSTSVQNSAPPPEFYSAFLRKEEKKEIDKEDEYRKYRQQYISKKIEEKRDLTEVPEQPTYEKREPISENIEKL